MAEMAVRLEGLTPSGGALPVSGTVTTIPSGTQNVAITGQPVGVVVANTALTPLYTTPVPGPVPTNTYVFSLDETPGLAVAANYVTVFNPLGSGKTLIFGGAFISCATAGGSTVTTPMRGFRITAASGGTLQLASAVAKFQSSMPNPVAEVRSVSVTATLGPAIFNVPPPESAGSGSTVPYGVTNPSPTSFTFVPGEGIAFRQGIGDVDLRWNLSLVWAEI